MYKPAVIGKISMPKQIVTRLQQLWLLTGLSSISSPTHTATSYYQNKGDEYHYSIAAVVTIKAANKKTYFEILESGHSLLSKLWHWRHTWIVLPKCICLLNADQKKFIITRLTYIFITFLEEVIHITTGLLKLYIYVPPICTDSMNWSSGHGGCCGLFILVCLTLSPFFTISSLNSVVLLMCQLSYACFFISFLCCDPSSISFDLLVLN